jgi:multiple sugar transport system permease protein
MSKMRRTVLSWLVLSPLVIVILFPFAVMLITALKPATEVLRPTWWPSDVRLSNFATMWSATNFGQALLNSLYVSAASTVAAIIVSIPAAYALSRFRFAGRGAYRQFLLISQMLSPIVLVIGLFRVLASFRLLDNLNSVALVYAAFNIAFTVWMLQSYFATIPEGS